MAIIIALVLISALLAGWLLIRKASIVAVLVWVKCWMRK